MSRLVAALAAALALIAVASGPAASAPAPAEATGHSDAALDASLQIAESRFIEAFRALDEGPFDAAWAEDATIFFPGEPFPAGRITGKAAITEHFHKAFATFRTRRPGARLTIDPKRVQIQRYGEIGIVTFELESDGELGRRTLVMRHAAGHWRIVHMHASIIEIEG